MISTGMAKYLRLSLLSACNLRCSYCQPNGNSHPVTIAPRDKVEQAIVFLNRHAIDKIRFTGGEPTLYKDLPGMIEFIKDLNPNIHTAITTNAVLLEEKAAELGQSGLDSVNISIDTLDPEKFKELTGSAQLNKILAGIEAAAKENYRVKLNTVLMRGFNDGEVGDLIQYADRMRLDIRFIEFMPNRYSAPDDYRFISGSEVRRLLPYNLEAIAGATGNAARYYASTDLKIRVGFIESVSHPFCGGCTRLRLAADGRLYFCLYKADNINLFELLDNNSESAEVEFTRFVKSKKTGNHKGHHHIHDLPSFSSIGG